MATSKSRKSTPAEIVDEKMDVEIRPDSCFLPTFSTGHDREPDVPIDTIAVQVYPTYSTRTSYIAKNGMPIRMTFKVRAGDKAPPNAARDIIALKVAEAFGFSLPENAYVNSGELESDEARKERESRTQDSFRGRGRR